MKNDEEYTGNVAGMVVLVTTGTVFLVIVASILKLMGLL